MRRTRLTIGPPGHQLSLLPFTGRVSRNSFSLRGSSLKERHDATEILARLGSTLLTAFLLLAVSACHSSDPVPPAPPKAGATSKPSQPTEPLKDEVPSAELAAVMTAHFRGLGAMEQYEYAQAIEAFRDVHARARAGFPGLSTWRSRF